jgi:hypothetical protein
VRSREALREKFRELGTTHAGVRPDHALDRFRQQPEGLTIVDASARSATTACTSSEEDPPARARDRSGIPVPAS